MFKSDDIFISMHFYLSVVINIFLKLYNLFPVVLCCVQHPPPFFIDGTE